ncbi:MAG: hypothetical protein ACYC3X_15435 [Pirellulaceae bacterium]
MVRETVKWFETLGWAVENALANSLAVILDLRDRHAMGEDPKGNHDKFRAFWCQAAPRFQDASRNVIEEDRWVQPIQGHVRMNIVLHCFTVDLD